MMSLFFFGSVVALRSYFSKNGLRNIGDVTPLAAI
jgi:hypothetical protein